MANLPEWFLSNVLSVREKLPDWFSQNVLGGRESTQSQGQNSDKERQLMDFIVKTEAGSNGYDAYYGNGTSAAVLPPPKPLTTMTIDEVLNWQKDVIDAGGQSAAGGYQIINATLKDAIKSLGISGSEVYDKNLQDKIASQYLLGSKRSVSMEDFLSGSATWEEFANDLSKEWASFPVVTPQKRGGRLIQPGQSYYSGVGANKALVSIDDMKNILT